MSRAFDSYYRDAANHSYKQNAQRLNPDAAKPVEEKKKGGPRRMILSGKMVKATLSEAGEMPPMPGAAPMPPPPGAIPPGPMPGAGPAPDAASKNFAAILMDAKNWLEQQKVSQGDLPPDAPEVSLLNSAIGMVSEALPQPGEDNTAIADKVSLLSQKMEQLFPNGGNGEIADYIRTLSAKLAEFRQTIDVTATAPAPEAAPAPAPHPKAEPKLPAQPPARPEQIAQGLEIAGGVS
jgi:hypothetical protein